MRERGADVTSKPYLSRILGDDDRGENHRHVFARFARQELGGRGERPEFVAAAALDGALHAARAAVVGRHRQMPVVEHPVERLQIFGRGDRRLFRIGPFVDVPVVLEPVFRCRCRS